MAGGRYLTRVARRVVPTRLSAFYYSIFVKAVMLAKRSMLGVFKKHYEALAWPSSRTVEIVVIVVSKREF